MTCIVSIEDPEGDGGQDAGKVEEDGGREGLLQGLQGRRTCTVADPFVYCIIKQMFSRILNTVCMVRAKFNCKS